MMIKLLIIVLVSLFTTFAVAEVYQTNTDFIKEVFEHKTPKPKVLWITKQLKSQASEILGNKPRQLRIRYWGKENKTAWILDEIGKEKPITFGVVIEADKIKQFKVLSFRESRGWEIVQPFYTDQFTHSLLKDNLKLDKTIDGISGATLSVRASQKMARMALLFHQKTPFGKN